MGQWPKGAYIWHPEGVVFHGHGHHTAGRLLVIDAGVNQRLKGCEDDVHPLSRPEVSSKQLWVEAGRGRDATLSTPAVLLGRAGRAALQRCWAAEPVGKLAASASVTAWRRMAREGSGRWIAGGGMGIW